DQLMKSFEQSPYTPPSYKEAVAVVTEPVLIALIEAGELVQITPDVLFAAAIYAEIVAEIRRQLKENGRVSVKVLRDRFNTSRKYALAVLEQLDAIGITRRDGDDHVLATGDWERLAQ